MFLNFGSLFLFTFTVFELLNFSRASRFDHGREVTCYLSASAIHRPYPGNFSIENINPTVCSKIIYTFLGLDNNTNTIKSINPLNDFKENGGHGSINKLKKLKKSYPSIKVMISVGGWEEGSINYSNMARNATSRQSFVKSVVYFLKKYGLDGMDLYWAYPGLPRGKPDDKFNLVLLLQELKEAFKEHDKILTAAVSGAGFSLEHGYDLPRMSQYVDFLHIISYDFHGTWEPRTGINAPLEARDNISVKNSIEDLFTLGAPPEKIVLGIPAFGHSYLVDDSVTDVKIGSPTSGELFAGRYTGMGGFLGYNEICEELQMNYSWVKKWDMKSSTPYAIHGKGFITYDNETSIALKVELGMKNKVGGFFVWSIDTDDFRGNCRQFGAIIPKENESYPYPIIRAIHRAIDRSDPYLPMEDLSENLQSKACSGLISLQLLCCAILTVIFNT